MKLKSNTMKVAKCREVDYVPGSSVFLGGSLDTGSRPSVEMIDTGSRPSADMFSNNNFLCN